jgi:hypothetical protein
LATFLVAVLFDFLAVFLICCVEQYFLGSSWSGDPVRPDPVSRFSGSGFRFFSGWRFFVDKWPKLNPLGQFLIVIKEIHKIQNYKIFLSLSHRKIRAGDPDPGFRFFPGKNPGILHG